MMSLIVRSHNIDFVHEREREYLLQPLILRTILLNLRLSRSEHIFNAFTTFLSIFHSFFFFERDLACVNRPKWEEISTRYWLNYFKMIYFRVLDRNCKNRPCPKVEMSQNLYCNRRRTFSSWARTLPTNQTWLISVRGSEREGER